MTCVTTCFAIARHGGLAGADGRDTLGFGHGRNEGATPGNSARAKVAAGLVGDQGRPLSAVVRGEKVLDGGVRQVAGVSVIGIAIGHRQLHRFRDGVDALDGRRIDAPGPAGRFQDAQRLEQHRSRRPEPRLDHLDSVKAPDEWFFARDGELGEIMFRDHPGVIPAVGVPVGSRCERDDRPRDRPAPEFSGPSNALGPRRRGRGDREFVEE